MHRKLLGEKHVNIEDIEVKTNSRISFPGSESGSDVVTIYGPEQQIENAQTRLLVGILLIFIHYDPDLSQQDLVPYEDELTFPPNSELPRICKTPEYKAFIESISREYQVVITPVVRTSGPGLEVVEGFKLNCLQSAKDSTATVKEMLDQFLITHSVQVYPATNNRVHKRVDSFADAFPHFDSKLLSHPKTRGGQSRSLTKTIIVG